MAILFITSTHIGDAILSTGVLDQLLKKYPDDPITIACGAPAAKVFEAVPGLARIHTLHKRSYSAHWFDLWRSTVTENWKVLVDLRRTILPYVLRAEKKYSLSKMRKPIHRVELISRMLSTTPLNPKVWINNTHIEQANTLVGDQNNFLAIAPGANWQGKIWPEKNFVELAHRLIGSGGLLENSRLLLVGAENERKKAQTIVNSFPSSKIVDAMGIDVLTTYAALNRCKLFVGNDSAMMHLAAASGKPTVGLFGPTHDIFYAPWGKNGLVVRTPESVEELIGNNSYNTNTTGTMMKNLTAETVETAIKIRWGNALIQ